MSAPQNPFDDVVRWRAKAAELRRQAGNAVDTVAREKLWQAAEQYERLAKEAKTRKRSSKPPPGSGVRAISEELRAMGPQRRAQFL